MNSPASQGLDEKSLARMERRAVLKYRATLMAALALPVFLETLDYTIVATAQPHIASAFNRLDLQSWVGTVYLLTSAVFLPVYASVADIYGRYWAMQSSILFFLIGSALSTGAQNMPMMLAGRGIAGIGAAGLLSVVRIIMSDSSSLDDNNWMGLALVALYAVGFCTGPVIGGALTSASFRWVFAINLPCCILSIILIFVLLRKTAKGPQPPRLIIRTEKAEPTATDRLLRIDWIAIILFIAGGIVLLLGLDWGANESWDSAKTIASLVIGVILITATLLWEFNLEHKQGLYTSASILQSQFGYASPRPLSRLYWADAMMPLAVFKNYDVCAVQFAAMTSGMVMLVNFYFVAIFMIIVNGLSATKAGLQLIYFAPGMGAGSILAMRSLKFTRQPRYPIVVGCLIVPISLGLISMAIDKNNQNNVNYFMILAGGGVGMTFGPLAIQARFSQPAERVAIVVALNLFFRSLGGTIGLAQCGTIMNAKVKQFFQNLPASALADITSSNGTIPAISAESLSSLQSISGLPPSVQELVKNAFRNGVRWSFISLIPWTCLSFIGVLFLSQIRDTDRDGKVGGREHIISTYSSDADKENQDRRAVRDVTAIEAA